MNKDAFPNSALAPLKYRTGGAVLETYRTFALSKYLLITPDLQYVLKPAQPTSGTQPKDAVVASLRFTLTF